ncbi:putative acyltransferase [Janthinobacterium lividum]|uniref:GNAT family N-acetyltransferase n=1 Tax=Janthinobacterium lividum TaxID=29581 RepID=UPI000DFA15B6|nr:GNAT family N-acetyltransferase [Janthinobacterium lividum]STR28109.1 putative acyltransferase [Janthinobacterium lividum]
MTKHTIRLGDWATLGPDATAIRFEVFVDEQKVPAEIELDEMDAVCLHAVAYDKSGFAIGTGRLLPDGHIGRMAVRQPGRGTGVGGTILTLLMDKARERGDKAVVLNAQTVAAPFYARHGFVQQGEQFEEAGIAHVEMRLQF